MTPGRSFQRLLQGFARVAALLVAATGAVVMIGWLFDIALFKSMSAGLATMKFNTACCFLMAGGAVSLLQSSPVGPRSLRLARILAGLVVAFAGLTLLEYAFGIDLRIDQLFAGDPANLSHPGRMAPATAISFISLGLALLALKSPHPRRAASVNVLIVPALFIATLAIAGYAYGVSSLYHVTAFASMAAHTAFALFAICLAVVATNTKHGLTRIAISDTAGGVVCRRLLPTIPLALFAFGWVGLQGEYASLYGTEFAFAVIVLLSITVSLFAIGTTAARLDQLDVTRKRAQADLAELNIELEARVAERTKRLSQLTAELTAANAALEKLSQHDELTGLANRRLFDSHLAVQIALARRNGGTLALVMCDVDSFKPFNDRYGHSAGDQCLKRIAAALQSCCRRPTDLVVRYGGEEFAILLPDTDLAGAAKIAELIRKAVARLQIPHAASPARSCVSISGGVAALDGKTITTAQQLIDAADQTLYRAKALGRNRMIAVQAEAA